MANDETYRERHRAHYCALECGYVRFAAMKTRAVQKQYNNNNHNNSCNNKIVVIIVKYENGEITSEMEEKKHKKNKTKTQRFSLLFRELFMNAEQRRLLQGLRNCFSTCFYFFLLLFFIVLTQVCRVAKRSANVC